MESSLRVGAEIEEREYTRHRELEEEEGEDVEGRKKYKKPLTSARDLRIDQKNNTLIYHIATNINKVPFNRFQVHELVTRRRLNKAGLPKTKPEGPLGCDDGGPGNPICYMVRIAS
ncbi:hypothetical protein DY000_02057145 [Brassica cretica]|uniref:Uncharacterized protein n=1 Tax=Brassica cretica TaxID=69181 RepID=A0ABQ7ADL9_BRACR|nr:hypothetical protein DY000_02057145 [Brassica cretica]